MICEVCGEDKVCLSTCAECDLKTFENIRKQGAVKELEKQIKWFKEARKEMIDRIEQIKANRNKVSNELIEFANGIINAFVEDYTNQITKLEKRLKELKEGC